MQPKQKPSVGKIALDYAVILLMAAVMAVNYALLILPNAFAPSGLNGIGTMLQYLLHFSVSYFSLIVNVPLAILCAIRVDVRFSVRTLIFSLTFSGLLLLLQSDAVDLTILIYHTDDGKSTLLAPVISGAVNGLIYGLTIRHGASTGGTDFIGALVHHRQPAYSLTHVILVLNSVIAGASYFVYDFNIEPVALCIIYSIITTYVSDRLIQGGKQAIRVELITAHPDEIAQAVISRLHHSVTILRATGGYSHQERTLMICVVNKHQITRLTEIISAFPDTFGCISSVSETVGNFKKIGLR